MSDSDQIVSFRDRHDEQYRAFQDREGIPVHEGWYVDDLRTLDVGQWDRTGGRGAFINLEGMELCCDGQLHELPPGESLRPQRHMHEALVFVVSGGGFTTIGDDEATFEWDENALFYLPHNTRYQLSNARGDEPARLLFVTSLPLLYTVFRTDEAVWDVGDYDQWSAIREEDYYTGVGELRLADDTRTYWTANFVPDVANFDQLASWSRRGGGNRSVFFPFPNTAMDSHISEFPPGQYKKAHRHLSGANLIILSGEGYSLLWKEGDDERLKVDWSPYSLFAPPTMYFHQHFNTSEEQARYVVLHGPQQQTGIQKDNDAIDDMRPENQIEYHQEDPAIRTEFEEQLAAAGIVSDMTDDMYEPPAE